MRLLVAVFLLALAAAPAHAQAVPDSSFAGDGYLRLDLGTRSRAAAVAPRADGSLVLALRYDTGAPGGVAWLTADGSLDPAFGTGGVVRLPSPSGLVLDDVTALTALPDGRWLVGGSVQVPDDRTKRRPFLVRLLPGGAPDASFGTDGVVVTNPVPAGDDVRLRGVAAGCGGYTLVGQATGGLLPDRQGYLTRILPDGATDATFATGGTYTTVSGGTLADVALRPDCRLLAVGDAWPARGQPSDALFVGLTPGGAEDPSVGVRTKNLYPDFSDDQALYVRLLADGRAVASGRTNTYRDGRFNEGTTLYLILPDGTLDPGYGFEGWTWTDVVPLTEDPTGFETPLRPVLTEDGFAVAVGTTFRGLRISAVLADGNPDPAYGPGGITRLFETQTSFFVSDADGSIASLVIGGVDRTQLDDRPAVARVRLPRRAVATAPAPLARARLDVAPNPTALTARITLTLDAPGPVSLRLVDALGRTVTTLADDARSAGAHTVPLDAAGLAPGVYALVVETSAGRTTRRLTVAR